MAIIQEMWDSRIGTSIGASGISMPRKFSVQIEDDDLPQFFDSLRPHQRAAVYPNPVTFVQRFAAPYGAPHPWDPNALVHDWKVVDEQPPRTSIVQVEYKTPTLIDSRSVVPGWTLRARGSLRQEEMLQELPPQAVERRSGIFSEGDPPCAEPKIIGSIDYVVAKSENEPGANFVAEFEDKTIFLKSSGQRVEEGYVRDLPQAELALSRDVPNFDVTKIGIIQRSLGHCNASVFYGANNRTLKLDSYNVSPRPGSQGVWDQRTNNLSVIWSLELNFSFRTTPHTPYVAAHRFPHPEKPNVTSLVRHKDQFDECNRRKVVTDSYRVAPLADFSALLRFLA